MLVGLIAALTIDCVVDPAGIVSTCPHTLQLPAVNVIDATFDVIPLLSETGVLEFVAQPVGVPPFVTCAQMTSPTFPAAAAAPLVGPTIAGVVIVGDVASTGLPVPVVAVTVAVPLENTGTPFAALLFAPSPPAHVPRGVVSPVRLVMFAFAPAVAMLELQPKPVPLVHCNACAAPLQPVTDTAVGVALDPVALPIRVFAPIAAIPLRPTPPHAGAVAEPVDTIA